MNITAAAIKGLLILFSLIQGAILSLPEAQEQFSAAYANKDADLMKELLRIYNDLNPRMASLDVLAFAAEKNDAELAALLLANANIYPHGAELEIQFLNKVNTIPDVVQDARLNKPYFKVVRNAFSVCASGNAPDVLELLLNDPRIRQNDPKFMDAILDNLRSRCLNGGDVSPVVNLIKYLSQREYFSPDMQELFLLTCIGDGFIEPVMFFLKNPAISVNRIQGALSDLQFCGRSTECQEKQVIDLITKLNKPILIASAEGNLDFLSKVNLDSFSCTEKDILIARSRQFPEILSLFLKGSPFPASVLDSKEFRTYLSRIQPSSMQELKSAVITFIGLKDCGFLPEIITEVQKQMA